MGLSTNQLRTWFLQGIQDWHDDDDDEYDEYEDELNTKNKFTLVSAKKLGLVLKIVEISGVTEPTKSTPHLAIGPLGCLVRFTCFLKSLRSGEWVQFTYSFWAIEVGSPSRHDQASFSYLSYFASTHHSSLDISPQTFSESFVLLVSMVFHVNHVSFNGSVLFPLPAVRAPKSHWPRYQVRLSGGLRVQVTVNHAVIRIISKGFQILSIGII